MVKPVKQYQGIIKYEDFFVKLKWNVEKYAATGRGLQYDPCHSG